MEYQDQQEYLRWMEFISLYTMLKYTSTDKQNSLEGHLDKRLFKLITTQDSLAT